MAEAAPPSPATPFLHLAAATVLALALGNFSHDLARWIVCLGSNGACSPDSKAEARTLATMVSTFLAVYLAAQAGRTGKKDPTEARLLVVGALAGALFAVLKATEGGGDVPDRALVFRPVLIWAMGTAMLLLPMWQTPPEEEHRLWALYQRLALAFLAAACIGGLLHLVAHHLWTVALDNGSSRKFVVAPVAPVIGGAVFGMLMLRGREDGQPRGQVLIWPAIAVTTVLVWTFADYLPTHASDGGWISAAKGAVSAEQIAAAYCLLILSGVLLMGVLALTGRPVHPAPATLAIISAACLIAAGLGAGLGFARVAAGKLAADQITALAAIQGLVPLAVWLSVVVAGRLQARVAQGRPPPPSA